MASLVSGLPAAFAKGRMRPMTASSSSAAKRFGTSPVFKMLLMSSKKDLERLNRRKKKAIEELIEGY